MFPLLIWELFSETASAVSIPDTGTRPHLLLLTQTIFFYNLFFLPPSSHVDCYYPLGTTTCKSTLSFHRAASLACLPQHALCTRGYQKFGEAACSLQYMRCKRRIQLFGDTNIMERPEIWHQYFTKWLSTVSAFWSEKQESKQDWDV